MFLRKERTVRDNFGGIVTCSRLKSANCRIGFEKRFFPGLCVSSYGWERAHTSGGTPVTAGAEGIIHAPAEVTLYYQRLGVEHFILELFRLKATDAEIWISTTLYTNRCTQRVRKIIYRIDAMRQFKSYGLYEAWMTIEDKSSNPVIISGTKELMLQRDWYRVLRGKQL